MSKDAYLAGLYGGSKKEFKTSQEKKSYDAGQQDKNFPKQKTKTKPKKEKKQSVIAKIGLGEIEKDYVGDDEFLKTVPEGQHKLRTQFDRLTAKYGDDFAETSQGQSLLNYLSGVSVNKGGGMGAPDPTFGTGVTIQDTDAQQARLDAIDKMGGKLTMPGTPGYSASTAETIKGLDTDLLREGLTPDQYFNFNQQLMQANVPAYQQARPFQSGYALPKILKTAVSPLGTIGGGIYESLTGKKFGNQKPDPVYTGEPLDPKLFYDLDNIEQSGLMGTSVARDARDEIDYNDPDDPDTDPPPGYDSWGDFYAASGILEGTGGFGTDGQYYFNYAHGGLAGLNNGNFNVEGADSLMFKDPVENDEWEYNV
tara:strand:- start:35 stop:1135 length:1101 start_codon:yes stop_codon:yes gene_type:complete